MAENKSNQIVLIATGEELTCGRQLETNCAFMAGLLATHGVDVLAHLTLGDKLTPLVEAIGYWVPRSRFLVISGGLGPTADDRTRHAIAAAAGRPLVLNTESLEHLERFFRDRGRAMSPTNRIQAEFPEGALIFPNDCGTARGFAVDVGSCRIIAIPGVPREMKMMFTERILPHILETFPARQKSFTRIVRLFGLPESEVDERLTGLISEEQNPAVGITVKDGLISISITGTGGDEDALHRAVGTLEQEIVKRIGDSVFGFDDQTLEGAVKDLLDRTGFNVAVAESCTGGLVGHLLTNVSGISAHFLEGIVAYSNPCKVELLRVDPMLIERFGAVSREVAEAMATGVRQRCNADVAVSTTGIAGPTGATPTKPVGLVYVGVAGRQGVKSRELLLHGNREMVKDRAAKYALNELRLLLADAPTSPS